MLTRTSILGLAAAAMLASIGLSSTASAGWLDRYHDRMDIRHDRADIRHDLKTGRRRSAAGSFVPCGSDRHKGLGRKPQSEGIIV